MPATTGISRWSGSVALVTGAGAGIGAAISKDLAKHGLTVIGCARDKSRIETVAKECEADNYTGKVVPYQCDLNNEEEIEAMFAWIKSTHGGIDVCVCNAGYAIEEKLLDATAKTMTGMLNVNVIAYVLCTKMAIKSMEERGVDGHVFHIGSALGYKVTHTLHFYSATKYAVRAITEGFRRELTEKKSKIRVTTIAPGLVGSTGFTGVTFDENVSNFLQTLPSVKPQDVSDALIYALSAPPTAQVHDILLEGTGAEA